MRILLFAIAFVAVAAAQAPPAPTVAVMDENGVAVSAARIALQSPSLPALRCQTDFAGRCSFPTLPAGLYELRVEKEGFYALLKPDVQIAPGMTIEVAISRVEEAREVVNVQESPPAIDPAQVSAEEQLSGLDVIDMVYSSTHDYRNALNFIPGVVEDQSGQPHVAGAQTYQTVTLLDGFNVTQPANGQLLVRVSVDAFRSIQVEPAREPAEDGKGSGGVLNLNTGIGDDHFRFHATDFIPSAQNKHGWRFDQFLPQFTFSGPLRKKKAWFYNAFDGEYDNVVYTELPVGQDNDHLLRVGDLVKIQTNITSRDILTTSFLANYLHDQYAFLSPLSPQLSNPKDVETAYIASIKDKHYFTGGELLETGFAYDQYNLQMTPYGSLPYVIDAAAQASGSFYLTGQTHARRWQGLLNLYIPPVQWHGRHDFKVGVDLDRISYQAQFARSPISFLAPTAQGNQSAAPCAVDANGIPTAPSACVRYSTFNGGLPSSTYNSEISAYAEDRWSATNRLLIEPGVRLDWDEIVRHAELAPRLAATYVLDSAGNTKLSAGVGLVYDATPVYLIARPHAGERTDYFFNPAGALTSTVLTSFSVDRSTLAAPRFLNWSLGLEKKLPSAVYLKAEFLEKRGTRGFVYDALDPPADSLMENSLRSPAFPSAAKAATDLAGVAARLEAAPFQNETTPRVLQQSAAENFVLQNTRDDRYTAFQVSLRHNFRETYSVMGAYTRSSARSNQALDFNVDNPILSDQQPGPYPWDAPNRFLSWGYVPFFKLPIIHEMELAYSMEARSGFPFSVVNDQQQLVSNVGAERFPEYFSLNLQLEKKFHLLGYYLALRGGMDNITGRCDPFVVNNVVDANHPAPTFSACLGRAFTSRIRLLGRK